MPEPGLGLANQQFPHLQPYAPTVGHESLQLLPHVAGRFDPSTQSVMINDAAQQGLGLNQTAGLISLERARGLLASPLGQQFTDNFPLPDEHRTFWDSFYLPSSVDAPTDQAGRDRILKSTILSRLLVGDTLPEGAPGMTKEQIAMADLFNSYARIGSR